MFPPGPPGNPRRVAPIALRLHKFFIHVIRNGRGETAACYRAGYAVVEFAARSFESGNAILQGREVNLAGQMARGIEGENEFADVGGVGREIEREDLSVGETQRHHAPQLRPQSVIAIPGISEMIHPVEIVIHGVIDAVRADESKSDGGNAEKIQEYGV